MIDWNEGPELIFRFGTPTEDSFGTPIVPTAENGYIQIIKCGERGADVVVGYGSLKRVIELYEDTPIEMLISNYEHRDKVYKEEKNE